jgi:hypothetical protein
LSSLKNSLQTKESEFSYGTQYICNHSFGLALIGVVKNRLKLVFGLKLHVGAIDAEC